MIHILITGENSYVGTNLETWLAKWPDRYKIDTISVRDDKWKEEDFSKYQVIFHVAAVVHKKEKSEMESLYFKINKDLAIQVAKKAKGEGVKQFIFMSSMSVYGIEGKVGEYVVIDKNTPCKPTTFYGKSKLEAELELNKMNDENFKVAIVRAPMIYGPNCPGNYTRLKKIVMIALIFPDINNRRSMLFVDNLSEFIKQLIDRKEARIFFPQNKNYVNIAELVNLIAKNNNKKIYFSKHLTSIVKLFANNIGTINKVFGNLVIDPRLSEYWNSEYCIISFEKSIRICEDEF